MRDGWVSRLERVLGTGAAVCLFCICGWSQAPVIVQPGAPGQETKTLPASARPTLPPVSDKDVAFMQGMIMHHSQAVEMTAMIPSRTKNKDLRLLGQRIGHTQADEIRFMERWLTARGQSTEMKMDGHDHHHHMDHMDHMDDMDDMDMDDMPPMPGMLTKKQMAALANAKGAEFDRLFLEGMIQHHGGALTMVQELFANQGAGMEADLFNFTTDIDTGQRAEIKIMQAMLDKKQ